MAIPAQQFEANLLFRPGRMLLSQVVFHHASQRIAKGTGKAHPLHAGQLLHPFGGEAVEDFHSERTRH